MKKIFILSALFMYGFTTFSQTLDDMDKLMEKKKYKDAIDSIGGDHNNQMIKYMK